MRRALPADIPELVRVTNLAYAVEAFCIEGERTSLAETEAMLATGVFLVAPDEADPERLCGAVYLKPAGAARWYLGPLSVDPAWQGRGLGRALVEAAEAFCRGEGARFMDLTVVSARKELFGFYERLGYGANDVLPFLRVADKLKVPCHLVKFTKALIPAAEL
jgi:ribosomal protein S18 acetylase RimI-like enzyme